MSGSVKERKIALMGFRSVGESNFVLKTLPDRSYQPWTSLKIKQSVYVCTATQFDIHVSQKWSAADDITGSALTESSDWTVSFFVLDCIIISIGIAMQINLTVNKKVFTGSWKMIQMKHMTIAYV